jgi:hypothetical protein
LQQIIAIASVDGCCETAVRPASRPFEMDVTRPGRQPSYPNLGPGAQRGARFHPSSLWWISISQAIVIAGLALNLLGDGLRDALDVRGVNDD